MKKPKKLLALFLALVTLCQVTACQQSAENNAPSTPETQASQDASGDGTSKADDANNPDDAAPAAAEKPTQDRSGAPIELPDNAEHIIALAPSIAETLIDLGCAESIIAIDTQTQSYAYESLSAELPAFDMMTPDTEQLANLKPDIVFISDMTSIGGTDPYAELKELGICVISIPSSDSIQGIKDDISFIASCIGKSAEGEQIVANLTAELDAIAAIGATITDKKSVYFEISADPYEYSFGTGTFLNEMIEMIGATNIFADQESWLSVAPESIIAANPDVIITNVNYMENPVDEILSREGWDGVTAIKDNAVFYVDNRSSSLPSENIVKALKEMASAIYPDIYAE